MTLNRLLGSVSAVLFVVGAGAPAVAAQPSAARYTVGDLVVRLVEEMGLSDAQQGPEAGRAFLAAAGVRVAGDLDSQLDEAETVAIFNQLGANVTTSNPGAMIDAQGIDQLLAITLPEGLPRVQAEGCHGGAGCDPLALLKQFCRKHPNLCKDIASRCGH
jgi:hypothetical protein